MARVQARKGKTQNRRATTQQNKTATAQNRMAKVQGNDMIFALDIGTRSIIGMIGVVEENQVHITAIEREEHAERAMIDGQIENIEKVSALADKVKKRLEAKVKTKLSRVCVAAAGRALRTRRADYELELPGTQLIDDEIISRLEAGAIGKAEEAFDAENEALNDNRRFYLVGYTVCQYYLDQYTMSNLKDHRGQHVKVDLIATFLPSEVVESLYTTMNKIGLEVASITLEPIAAINAAIPENLRLLNLALVDIGAGTSDIAACTGGGITGYTMATVAGDEITEAIMKKYLVDFGTAETIKAQIRQADPITFTNILGFEQQIPQEELLKSIKEPAGLLCREIADKILEINGGAPSALFLAGGGSKLAGLKDELTMTLGMDETRVAVAGNYFHANAYSAEYELNNPEYATPLGIVVSSGLNMINDSFRVMLNGRPAKLFRTGSFTALNLLMMNGYNFRDIIGRSGANLTVTVNGRRKVFYGTSTQPASLLINQQEGKLSEVIHAGDVIDFVPAVQGIPARPCLGDIEGAATCTEITLNGAHVSLKTLLKNGDSIMMDPPAHEESFKKEEHAPAHAEHTAEQNTAQTEKTAAAADPVQVFAPSAEMPTTAPVNPAVTASAAVPAAPATAASIAASTTPATAASAAVPAAPAAAASIAASTTPATAASAALEGPAVAAAADSTVGSDVTAPANPTAPAPAAAVFAEPVPAPAAAPKPAAPKPRREFVFHLNDSTLRLPCKPDGSPYYLMDMIEYSGIDLKQPKGRVKLTVNGRTGMFQQALSQGDVIYIEEELEENQ